MVQRMTESDCALMLGGDLLITIFEVGGPGRPAAQGLVCWEQSGWVRTHAAFPSGLLRLRQTGLQACRAGLRPAVGAAAEAACAVQASGLKGQVKNTHPFVRLRVGQQQQLTSIKWSTLGPTWEGEPITFKRAPSAVYLEACTDGE